jgi:hypothetical protein
MDGALIATTQAQLVVVNELCSSEAMYAGEISE